ncbi:hypothetical protein AC578_5630 [Pseudocercospora eumusae]|uniref:rRNA methyltransferase 1, mitochondrial n=1 Tax=Pseudocercospora eumusae TaxID=321146 RepID=A0A139HT99_9PEZI|nr:hypothetical protein AC578_5630 [Pseudocercospora eumusae]
MSSSLLQRHLCFHCRLSTGQRALVSTTSAINRGLRATRDGDNFNRGGRDRSRRAIPSTRTGSRDRPSLGKPRRLSDHVETSRFSDQRGRYGLGQAKSAREDRPSSRSGFRDRDRPQRSSYRSDEGSTSRSSKPGNGRSSRLSEDYDFNDRGREQPPPHQGRRNRPGQRERRERALAGKPSGGMGRRHDGGGNDRGPLSHKPRDLRKHIKNACRQIHFIQSKESAGEDVRDLISDVKFSLKNINMDPILESDDGADEVVALFRDGSKDGTFLAGDLPDGKKSVIYITEQGTLDVDIATSPKITKDPNQRKAAYMEEKAKVRSEPSKPAKRERRASSDEGDENVPLAVPYSRAGSEFLYGYNSVLAALRAKRRKCYKLYIHPKIFERDIGGEGTASGEKPFNELQQLAKAAKITIVNESRVALLNQMSGDRPHNGVVLETSRLPAPPILGLMKPELRKGIIPVELGKQSNEDEEINGAPGTIRALGSSWRHPFVLLLDGITDPGNVGNIIRTAHFYGVDAVAIATNTCANLSSAVLAKASSGACEAVQILAVPSASGFIHSCSRYRWKIYGAVAPTVEEAGRPNNDQHITASALSSNSPLAKHSCILMLGAEGEGLRQNLRARADKFVSIEGGARAEGTPDVGVDSMNVGVATGVLLEAFLRKPVDAPSNIVADSEESIGF